MNNDELNEVPIPREEILTVYENMMSWYDKYWSYDEVTDEICMTWPAHDTVSIRWNDIVICRQQANGSS